MTHDQNGIGQARRERDEAQERFEITFDANPAPSMIVRLEDAEVVALNPGLTEVSGRNDDEVKGRSVRTLNLFEDEEAFERILGILREGGSTSKETLTMISHTKGPLTMLVSAKPIDLEGDACGIFTFSDVTELKKAQELFTQAFRLAPVPVTLSNDEHRFTEVNEAYLALTGYTRDEVVGQRWRDLQMWSSPEDHQKIAEALRNEGEFYNLDLALKRKDGDELRVIGSGKILDVSGERVLLHIFYDVTERRRNDEQMTLAADSVMAEASWFSQEFVARLNHLRSGGRLEDYRPLDLSPREREVLIRVAKGWTNKRISEELSLKQQTVRNYLSNIFDKIGVHSRTEAAVWARKRGLVTD